MVGEREGGGRGGRGEVGVEVEEWAQGGRRETMRAHRHRAPRSAQTETRTLVYHVILWVPGPGPPAGAGQPDGPWKLERPDGTACSWRCAGDE